MATSINGMIAKKDDDTKWISGTEWDSYSSAVRNAGCLIVGRRTYNILTKQPEFSEFKDVELVAVSNESFSTIANNHYVANSPKEALEKLKNFETVIIAGGGILNSSFLNDGLIDEIYLDIEPIALGKGINIFENEDFEVNLELLETRQLSKNEIQLHYKVVK